MNVSYPVHMDYEGFRELFLAQQGAYMRKLGILCALLCGALGIAGVVVVAGRGEKDMALSALALLACAAFGAFLAVRPSAMLCTRGGLVRSWFNERGCAGGGRLQDISCNYTVECDERGFSEVSGESLVRTAWYELSEKPREGQRGTYFVVSKGREDSLLYNLMGINWALRDEAVSGTLFVPREAQAANEGLVDKMRRHIAAARQEHKAIERGRAR